MKDEAIKEPTRMDILFNPSRHGYVVCTHCNGYGSSLKDPEPIWRCSVCGGLGLVKEDGMNP